MSKLFSVRPEAPQIPSGASHYGQPHKRQVSAADLGGFEV